MSHEKISAVTFAEKYSTVSHYLIETNLKDQRPRFIDQETPKICRFCLKDSSETTFKKKAHAVPESIGNRTLFTKSECDYCNEYFANSYEDSFSKFFGVTRTLTRTKAKKGVPGFRSKDRSLDIKVDAVTGQIHVTVDPKSGQVKLDTEKGIADFIVEKEPYIPYAVYKCLLKIGYSLLPQQDIGLFDEVRRFLLQPLSNKANNFAGMVLQSALPFPTNSISCGNFRRKAGVSKEFPFQVFALIFKSVIFQTYIPVRSMDSNQLSMHIMPFTPEVKDFYPMNLSSTAKVYGEKMKMPMKVFGLSTHGDPTKNQFLQSLRA